MITLNNIKHIVKYIILTFFVGVSVMNVFNMVKHVDYLLEEK